MQEYLGAFLMRFAPNVVLWLSNESKGRELLISRLRLSTKEDINEDEHSHVWHKVNHRSRFARSVAVFKNNKENTQVHSESTTS